MGLIDWPSLAKAVAVHVVIAAIFLVGWGFGSEPEKPKELPPHIKAVIVERPKPIQKPPIKKKVVKKPVKKKAVPKKPVKKKTVKKKAAPKKPVKKKPVVKKTPPKKKEVKKKEVKKVKQPSFEDIFAEEAKDLQKEKKEQERQRKEAEKKRQADQLRQQELEKRQQAEAARIASKIDNFTVLMQQTMRRHWKRPQVARDNLVVRLAIKLDAGGRVQDVKVSKSSGNAAFDNSALRAVKKAGYFSVPDDPALFNEHFKSFTMVFNPNEI